MCDARRNCFALPNFVLLADFPEDNVKACTDCVVVARVEHEHPLDAIAPMDENAGIDGMPAMEWLEAMTME